ncbi:MAG: hypothetical protein IJX23_01215 [Clostridia bacterium]|nr:hypothetical protein [Clostridia bacterium]
MKRYLSALLAIVLVLTLVFGAACQTLENHEHAPATEWTTDETGHWHACTFKGCAEKLDFAAHTGGTATYTEVATCSVCDTNYGEIKAHDCNWEETSRTVTCIKDGKINYKCTLCGAKKSDSVKKLGHNFPEQTSYGRLIACQNPKCKVAKFPNSDSKFREQVKYTFDKEDETRINNAYEDLVNTLDGYGEYDATLHAYNPDSEWFAKNEDFEAAVTAFEDELYFVIAQYQYAKIEADIDFTNEEKQDNQLAISNYYDTVLSYYNGLFPLVYETPLREFFYYGMPQDEIDSLLEETRNASDPEWVRLSGENNAKENEYNGLSKKEIETGSRVPELYEEFVANNNAMAKIKGYDNYMEYAYKEIYGREYTPEQSAIYFEYLKQYIAPLYSQYYGLYNDANDAISEKNKALYEDFAEKSFFTSITANHSVNDFLPTIKTTDDAGNETSYADIFEELMENKNYFTGSYNGAYMWYIRSLKTPILYFGQSGGNTVVHEFGHYCNELKNYDYSQSFDLSETHSQGLEVLYLSWLRDNDKYKDYIPTSAFDLYNAYQLYNNLWLICIAAGVDAFERAVYTNTYNGASADTFLADGKITKEEYDPLFEEILTDVGVGTMYKSYWRQVAIRSAAYYISYSVSMCSSLQLMSDGTNYDEMVESYLKLVNYSDIESQRNFTYKEVLEYAGLYAYDNEEMFKYINRVLSVE